MTDTVLTPEEDAIYQQCLAKLRRSSTLPTRVEFGTDGTRFTAKAFSQIYDEQGEPGKPARSRERMILSISSPSAAGALQELLEQLG